MTEALAYLESVVATLRQLDCTKIDEFVDKLLDTHQKNGTIYFCGNGGSAANASHFAGDMVKGVSYGLPKRFRAICLSDNTPALMAIANDISYAAIFSEQLKNFLTPDDIVVGISGSGNSPNVVNAIKYAKEVGAYAVAICGYDGGQIKSLADLAIHADIKDMEVCEDIHSAIMHCTKRVLMRRLGNFK